MKPTKTEIIRTKQHELNQAYAKQVQQLHKKHPYPQGEETGKFLGTMGITGLLLLATGNPIGAALLGTLIGMSGGGAIGSQFDEEWSDDV